MVNIDELRKKYQEINNPGGAKKDNKEFLEKFFMMEEGTSLVRILPGKNDQEFYAETAIHRINDKNYHCPRVKGDKCPVCDTYFNMWKEINAIGKDTPKGQELAGLARQIKSYKRFYMNVVDRRSESVKILSVGQKLFGKILDCFFDEDFGDLTDLKEGWDFKIVKEQQNQQWPNYDKSSPKPKQTAAGSDKEIAEWMDEQHDIHGLVKVAEYEELKTLMEEFTAITRGTSISQESDSDSGSDDDDGYLSHLKSLKID